MTDGYITQYIKDPPLGGLSPRYAVLNFLGHLIEYINLETKSVMLTVKPGTIENEINIKKNEINKILNEYFNNSKDTYISFENIRNIFINNNINYKMEKKLKKYLKKYLPNQYKVDIKKNQLSIMLLNHLVLKMDLKMVQLNLLL